MDFTVATSHVLRRLGYLDRSPSDSKLVKYTKRIMCLVACASIVPLAIWTIAYKASTFVEKVKPLMPLYFGTSSFIFYSLMLSHHRSIFDVLAKLQDRVNERMLKLFIKIAPFQHLC